VGGQRPLGGQPQRPDDGAILHWIIWLGGERGTRPRLGDPGSAAQPGPQRLGSGDQQRLELPAGIRAHLDRTGAGKLQHPQRLPLATLPWAGQVLPPQGLPTGPDGIQRVALGAGPATRPLGPVDLEHPLAMLQQEAGQPGAVAAGALQRPAAATRCSLGDQAQKCFVAGLAAWDLQLGDQAAVGVQDRGGVGIAVGVDPNDVVGTGLGGVTARQD
jgi:hypothetical protein